MSSDPTPIAPVSTSLADRITRPAEASKPDTDKAEAPAASEESSTKASWADEVASPTTAEPQPVPTTAPASKAAEESEKPADAEKSQGDGAGELFGGSDLREPDYNVEVKLSDIQADPNNPLFSVKSFEELGGL